MEFLQTPLVPCLPWPQRKPRYNRRVKRLAILLLVALSLFAQAQPDYPGATWNPADSSNFTVANRPASHPILYIVIHVMQGSYNGAISWFKNPASNVSAHYLMRAADGDITQMVRNRDIGWHAGNWTYNTRSIGIEHEGFVSDPNWFTPTVYQTSARLSRYLSLQYGFLRTREHIIGHVEVPGATHTDPGPHWNWNLYMSLVRLGAEYAGGKNPGRIKSGSTYPTTLFFTNSADDPWPAGGDIRLATANPVDSTSPFYDPATWISPTRVGGPAGEVPPGGTGAFPITLRAPAGPGIFSGSFQLVKEGVGRFGPIVTLTIVVGTGEKVIDNDSADFETFGTWSTGTTAPGHYGPDYRFAASNVPTNFCNWFLGVPTEAYYDVYAWWSQGTNRSDAVTYSVNTGTTTANHVLNQQANGGRWNLLGRYYIRQGDGFVKLTATGPAGKVAIADAVKIVGPFFTP